MPEKAKDRRTEILNAALSEFAKKGVGGARLQTIADNSNVTKAMIHYYFDTKENLFKEVFREAYDTVMGSLFDILEKDTPLFLKIEEFIGAAIERFQQRPALVEFISSALNKNPEPTVAMMQELLDYDGSVFEHQLKESAASYEIAAVDSSHVILNMLALCMFPYSARTFMSELLPMNEGQNYDDFLSQRKGVVTDTIINWLAS